MIIRLLLSAGLSAIVLLLASCASSGPKPYDDNISNLPQNRPQAWEGNAAMGAFFPQSM